jgi:hypothetical protein
MIASWAAPLWLWLWLWYAAIQLLGFVDNSLILMCVEGGRKGACLCALHTLIPAAGSWSHAAVSW